MAGGLNFRTSGVVGRLLEARVIRRLRAALPSRRPAPVTFGAGAFGQFGRTR